MKKKLLLKISACALSCAALLGIAIPVTIHCCHEAAEEAFCRNEDYFMLTAWVVLEDEGYCREDISEWIPIYDKRMALVVTDNAIVHAFVLKEPQPWVFVWEKIGRL